MMIKLTLIFKIEMESDYHVSAGGGKGSEIDSALVRDSDGVPVLRGTTITGLLRDSMWQLLQLSPLKKYNDAPIEHIFGTAATPKPWRITSARPSSLPISLSRYDEEDTHIIQRASINPRTRRAREKQLFTQENGNGRFAFSFKATALGYEETILDEAAFIVAAANNLRHLGRSRRRGQGKCRVNLDSVQRQGLPASDITQETLLNRFQEQWLAGMVNLAVRPDEIPAQLTISHYPVSQYLRRFYLIIRTDEPVIVSGHNEAGNQYKTMDVISGTALRGAFATRAADANDLADTNHYEKFVQLFWRGQLRFSPLYPVRQQGRNIFSAIPTPFDFATCKVFPGIKEHEHGIVVTSLDSRQRCEHCKNPLKYLSDFITVEQNQQLITPHRCQEMHIRLEPVSQRVKSGKLFGYVALGVGQYFIGELSFLNEAAFEIFQEMMGDRIDQQPFELHLGKATRRGYGKVTVQLIPGDSEESVWTRLPFAERVSPEKERVLILTFLTDIIMTDTWGRYLTSLDIDSLKSWLKIPFNRCEVFTKSRLVDSFNTYIGLPRPRDVTICAGTSISLYLSDDLTQEQLQYLQNLESERIGLRRNEGFGQIVFNHPVYYHKYQALRGKIVNLDNPDMRQEEIDHNHFLVETRRFKAKWQDELKVIDRISWKEHPVNDLEKLIAVAKWLQTNIHQPLDALLEQITDWKNNGFTPDDELTRLIPDYGPPDYNKREPKKMKRTEVLKEIIDLISNLQNLLQKYHSVNQEIGLTLLTDRIAAEAKLARKENSQ